MFTVDAKSRIQKYNLQDQKKTNLKLRRSLKTPKQTVRRTKTRIYMKKPKIVQQTKKMQQKSFKNLKK